MWHYYHFTFSVIVCCKEWRQLKCSWNSIHRPVISLHSTKNIKLYWPQRTITVLYTRYLSDPPGRKTLSNQPLTEQRNNEISDTQRWRSSHLLCHFIRVRRSRHKFPTSYVNSMPSETFFLHTYFNYRYTYIHTYECQ